MSLDTKDWEIINLLRKQGRRSAQEVADLVNLSPSATSRRINRLEASGVIEGYAAIINDEKAGYAVTVIVEITLDSQADDALDAFESAIINCPSVQSCYLMSGQSDYQLTVKARDIEDFERIHRKILSRLPHVDRLHTAFALRQVVKRGMQVS